MTASRTQYIVYASTKVDAISIGNQINSTVGHPGSVRYLKPDDGHGIPAMWLVPQYSRDVSSAGLKKSEASAIGKLPGVSAVFPDRVVSKRAPSTSVAAISATPDFKPPITCSTDAARAGLDVPIELRSIAQPQGVNPAGAGGLLNYVYRPPAGEGTWVYMIDSGVNRNHPEFTSGCTIAPFSDWIIEDGAPVSDGDEDGHGDQVASKICGKIAGVAKKTTIIPVKDSLDTSISSSCTLWRRVLDDVIKRQGENPPTALPGKTVVNFSTVYYVKDSYIPEFDDVRLTITSLMELGVIVVVPAGNIGKGSDTSVLDTTSEVRHPPAMWAEDGFPLIVASSVSQSFSLTPDSKYGPQTCVWGVGEWCVVANLDSYTYRSGTSYVAGQVSGLLAYFLSLDQCPFSLQGSVAHHAREFFKTGAGAYPRGPRNLRVMWNQMDGRLTPNMASRKKEKRDGRKACAIKSDLPTLNTVSTKASPPAPLSTLPYVQGTCKVHLELWKSSTPRYDTGTYTIEASVFDNDGNKIISPEKHPSINAQKPLRLNIGLKDPLVCIPEKNNDYVQFKLGSDAWPSSNGARCNVGKWDEHIKTFVSTEPPSGRRY